MSGSTDVPIAFEGMVAHLLGGRSIAVASSPPGPPVRVDGYSIGVVPVAPGPGPHLGELHPDGDELLYVFSGSMDLIIDDGDKETVGVETSVRLRPGDAFVVPRGIWHRLEAREPGRLLHITPGPGGDYRPR
ncbi:MAG: cupin domain-containing protein [Acidimicrobiales bacterium]